MALFYHSSEEDMYPELELKKSPIMKYQHNDLCLYERLKKSNIIQKGEQKKDDII